MIACGNSTNGTSPQQPDTTRTTTAPQPPSWLLGSVGDTSDAQGMATQAGIVLMGGSTDVDEAMRWLLDRSGGGDVVIIRATGSTGYNDYLFALGAKVHSVETILINSRALANDPAIERRLRNAEMVFIAGGDQADYVNFWRGTKVQEALNWLANVKKIPIGGTSAGCAILGRIYFGALQGTIRSEAALQNPYNPLVTVLRNDFLTMPFLENTITDMHYDNPVRVGRHLTFMARMIQDSALSPVQVRGIGVEERTAVAINAEGQATVFGRGQAYFLQGSSAQATPEVCRAGQPLTWDRNNQAVRGYVIPGSFRGNGTFNLATWAESGATGGTWRRYWVSNGVQNEQ
jgi:cyanophycinase-like exopeptidase